MVKSSGKQTGEVVRRYRAVAQRAYPPRASGSFLVERSQGWNRPATGEVFS
jgi:hypothetical protein